MVCRQCGERYLQKERRCFVLDKQNRKTPWVRWKPFRGWRMDELPIPQKKVYRGISVVNTVETVGLLWDFIKSRNFKFCLYDNGGDGTGMDADDHAAQKFYLSEPFIPKDFFPPEYWNEYHALDKSALRLWRNSTYRLAECDEDFYSFLKLGLGMSMGVAAFFNTFIPFAEIYQHMHHGSFDHRLSASCELFIETAGHDNWYLDIYSKDKTMLETLAQIYTVGNYQVCRVIADDSGDDAVYEFHGFLEKISKSSPPVPNKVFDWNLYNDTED